jgi:hypothetical protein
MLACGALLLRFPICLQDIDGVDDAANFAEVLEALSDIGLSPADTHALLSTLSGILWLGNLRVEPVHADDSSRIKIDAALSNAASMLGLREKELAYAITHKKVRRVALAVAAEEEVTLWRQNDSNGQYPLTIRSAMWPSCSLLLLHVVHVCSATPAVLFPAAAFCYSCCLALLSSCPMPCGCCCVCCCTRTIGPKPWNMVWITMCVKLIVKLLTAQEALSE